MTLLTISLILIVLGGLGEWIGSDQSPCLRVMGRTALVLGTLGLIYAVHESYT
jgi:hypothetical protein